MTIAHAGWDEPLDEEERTWWDKWLKKLEELRYLRIPRCIRPVPGTDIETEMHIFCDASEEAFAAVAYLRTVKDGRYLSSNIIIAKTRVAPKRTISVAKLELQAALLGSRIAKTLGDEMTLPIHRRRL